MRSGTHLVLVVLLIAITGCTHIALERRTVKQASTLTDLQYKQVLDNLAMFACNSEAMPWHVKLKGGLVQITDQGSSGFGADIAAAVSGDVTRLLPAVSAERGVVGQWELDPTAEPEELDLLRLAYRKATDPTNSEIAAEIDKAIGELSVQFDVLPKPDTLFRIFSANMAAEKIRKRLDELKELIPNLHLELASVPPAPEKEIEAAKKAVATAREAIINAKTQNEKKEAEAALTKAIGELAKAQDQKGASEMRTADLEGKLDQLRREEVGLREMLRLVTAPIQLTSTQYATGASPITSRVGSVIAPQNVLEKLFGSSGKKDTPADQKTLLLTAVSFALDSYVPSPELREATQRNVGLVAQAEDKIRKLEHLVEMFNTPWLKCGKKHDIPKCACYVGQYCDCVGVRHVWVMPEQLGTLREFTLIVLALAPIEKQELFPSRGAAFSPSLR